MNRPITHASLFSGIGGPECAAAMLGWTNLFHCEINPFGRRVLEYWFPESVSYEDITKTDFTQWRGKVDVLTGGFPCQPFSTAGKRKGSEDERYLWPEMCHVIDEIRPAWVVGENVAGITSMVEGGVLTDLGREASLFDEGDGVHRYRLEQTFTIERICRDLEAIGYEVQPVLIPAAAVGAPHRRDRVFFLAHIAENAVSDGCQRKSCNGEEESAQRGQRVPIAGDSERICCQEGIASSDADRDGGPSENLWGKSDGCETDAKDNGKSQSVLHSETVTDTIGARPESERQRRKDKVYGFTATADANSAVRKRRDGKATKRWGRPDIRAGQFDSSLLPENQWRDFPTVAPVCGRYDGFSRDMVRYINDEVYATVKEYFGDQDLPGLWQAIRQEEVRESLGRLYKIQQPDLLLQVLQCASQGRRPESNGDRLSTRSVEVSQRVLRELRKYGETARASQRLQYQEQCTRELGYALPALSFDLALATKTIEKEVIGIRNYIRTESIRAYGNAIVPQVMYRIFQGIAKVEEEESN